ncbi:MAG: transglycosylase domain-containing protein, partial [Anaerolineae bacterium]|nr:transglycosylase domain-containing protein [Anaerolineae bacterium]
ATVVVEDRSFYSRALHWKMSSIFRSIWYSIQHRKYEIPRPRDTTIPGQLVTNLTVISGRDYGDSFRQDMRDLILTIMVTHQYSHNEILEFYLNSVNYGDQIYGVEAAAQHYFGKSVRDLNLAESAMLSSIVQLSSFSSQADLEYAQTRQYIILDLMVEEGYISEQESETAKRERLNFVGF